MSVDRIQQAARNALGQVRRTVQRAGQTIATGARTAARRAGEFAAWTERQSEELFRGRVTPQTVAGTAASFVLPTTVMQIAGGQKKADIRNPETAVGLGSDVLLMIPVAGAVARAARAGSTAARAAGSAAGAATQPIRTFVVGRAGVSPQPMARTLAEARAAPAPAVARLVAIPTSLVSTFSLAYI